MTALIIVGFIVGFAFLCGLWALVIEHLMEEL